MNYYMMKDVALHNNEILLPYMDCIHIIIARVAMNLSNLILCIFSILFSTSIVKTEYYKWKQN
jgi:hypothetical protein